MFQVPVGSFVLTLSVRCLSLSLLSSVRPPSSLAISFYFSFSFSDIQPPFPVPFFKLIYVRFPGFVSTHSYVPVNYSTERFVLEPCFAAEFRSLFRSFPRYLLINSSGNFAFGSYVNSYGPSHFTRDSVFQSSCTLCASIISYLQAMCVLSCSCS